MSDYTKTTDFGAKDSLPTGNSGKLVKGSDFDTEFDNIATAVATKFDSSDLIDEDNMASNSATKAPTQQSVKAYVDASQATYVNDAGGGPVIDDTIFDFYNNITAATWESVGPTGSGADNIWTALDAVPSDADWVELKVMLSFTSASAGGSAASPNYSAYGRSGTSSETVTYDTLLAWVGWYQSSGVGGGQNQVSIVKVPCSTGLIFDFYHTGAVSPASWGTQFGRMHLVGYGYNR